MNSYKALFEVFTANWKARRNHNSPYYCNVHFCKEKWKKIQASYKTCIKIGFYMSSDTPHLQQMTKQTLPTSNKVILFATNKTSWNNEEKLLCKFSTKLMVWVCQLTSCCMMSLNVSKSIKEFAKFFTLCLLSLISALYKREYDRKMSRAFEERNHWNINK